MPTCTLNPDLEEMAEWGIESYREADQIIVVEDGGNYSEKLRKLADIYIYCQKNEGFSKTVNRGWRLAEGEYVAIVNSDTDLLEGKLKDLCVEGRVTSPITENVGVPKMAGHFFCVPAKITEKYGYLDERMKMYVSDSEYEGRIEHLLLQVSSVKIWHENQATTRVAGVGEKERDEDRATHQRHYTHSAPSWTKISRKSTKKTDV